MKQSHHTLKVYKDTVEIVAKFGHLRNIITRQNGSRKTVEYGNEIARTRSTCNQFLKLMRNMAKQQKIRLLRAAMFPLTFEDGIR